MVRRILEEQLGLKVSRGQGGKSIAIVPSGALRAKLGPRLGRSGYKAKSHGKLLGIDHLAAAGKRPLQTERFRKQHARSAQVRRLGARGAIARAQDRSRACAALRSQGHWRQRRQGEAGTKLSMFGPRPVGAKKRLRKDAARWVRPWCAASPGAHRRMDAVGLGWAGPAHADGHHLAKGHADGWAVR